MLAPPYGQRQSSARLSSYTTIITLAKVSVEYVEDYSKRYQNMVVAKVKDVSKAHIPGVDIYTEVVQCNSKISQNQLNL